MVKDRTNVWQRIICLCIAVLMFFLCLPMQSEAGLLSRTYYYIQTVVNSDDWTIAGSVVTAGGGLGKNPVESQTYSDSTLSSLYTAGQSITGSIPDWPSDGDTESGSGGESQVMTLTFPGTSTIYKSANGLDYYNEATRVLTATIYDLNTAIEVVYPDRSDWSDSVVTDKLEALVEAARLSSSINGCSFSTITSEEFETLHKGEIDGKDCFRKLTDADGHSYILQIATHKYSEDFSGEDAKYVTWEHLAFEALGNYFYRDLDIQDVYTGYESTLISSFSELLGNLCHQIESVLQLWTLDELIFNGGIRGQSMSYVHGVFPVGWEPIVWAFFCITETIALILILYSLIKALMTRSLQTANFMSMKVAWEKIQSFISAGIILALLPLLIQIIMTLSASITGMLADVAYGMGEETIVEFESSFSRGSGSIGSIVMRILFLLINLYYNFFYALRSLGVALLIMVAPIAVVSMTFDNKYKTIMSSWLSEFLTQILTQPIHAFIFTIIMIIPTTGHGFDNIMLMYASIPFTNLLKGILLPGGGGDLLHNAARTSQGTTSRAMKGAAVQGAGAFVTGVGAARQGFAEGRAANGSTFSVETSSGTQAASGTGGVSGTSQSSYSTGAATGNGYQAGASAAGNAQPVSSGAGADGGQMQNGNVAAAAMAGTAGAVAGDTAADDYNNNVNNQQQVDTNINDPGIANGQVNNQPIDTGTSNSSAGTQVSNQGGSSFGSQLKQFGSNVKSFGNTRVVSGVRTAGRIAGATVLGASLGAMGIRGRSDNMLAQSAANTARMTAIRKASTGSRTMSDGSVRTSVSGSSTAGQTLERVSRESEMLPQGAARNSYWNNMKNNYGISGVTVNPATGEHSASFSNQQAAESFVGTGELHTIKSDKPANVETRTENEQSTTSNVTEPPINEEPVANDNPVSENMPPLDPEQLRREADEEAYPPDGPVFDNDESQTYNFENSEPDNTDANLLDTAMNNVDA